MKTRNLILGLVLALCFGLTACNTDYGKTVEQGRCVFFDGKTVKFVRDGNVDPRQSAKYEDILLTFNLPADPKEKGPDPTVGNLVSLDTDKKEVKVFKDDAISNHPVEIVNVQKGVERHASAVKDKTFPMVNSDKKEVTVYIGKTLATFKVPSDLPSDENFWKHGDNVRVFFKEKGKALRFMNITKTNIFKK